jgi:hypothetical protein
MITPHEQPSESPPDGNRSFNRRDALLVLGLITVAAASTLPFFYAAHGQMPEAGDLTNHWPRIVKFDETLRSGVWYPRWLGGMNYDYGAATTIYYAPLLYYALSAAHVLAGDWFASIAWVMVLAATASAIALYVYARGFLSRTASAVAALLYLLLPYRLIDLYHRGALAELIAFVWMPLILAALDAAVKRPSAARVAVTAFVFGLLVVTHPPTAYLFCIALAVLIATQAIAARSWRPITISAIALAVGSALSAVYWLPAITEAKFVHQGITDLFHNRKGFVTELLTGSTFERLVAAVIILTAVLFALYSWLVSGRSRERQSVWFAKRRAEQRSETTVKQSDDDSVTNWRSKAWLIIGAMAFLMMTPVVGPLLRLMPGIDGIAFMWRWMAVATLATAMLAGAAVERWRVAHSLRRREARAVAEKVAGANRRLSMVATLATTLAVLGFGIIACARASNLKQPFAVPVDYVEQDFTPAGAPSIGDLPDAQLQLLSGAPENRARLIEWKPQERVIEVSATGPDTLHVCSFMFPGWMARLDGEDAPLRQHPTLKTMLIDVPSGSHTIRLTFANTPMRGRAEAVSGVALIICAGMVVASLVRQLRRRRQGLGTRQPQA